MRKIGKYEILGLLGRGSMGAVYKVRLPVIGKVAALKLFSPNPLLSELLGEETLKKRFVEEARIIASLRHPNIVDIRDFDEVGDRPFFTMEYYCNNLGALMGETYRLEQPSRSLRLRKAVWYIRQTLEGLACLHDADIIHRDIKPYNLLLTDEEVVKISDFGLSRLRGETFAGPENLNLGSPYYAAPEQELDPDLADGRADLYSVGMVFYRMLTGRLRLEIPEEQDSGLPGLEPGWEAFILKAIHPEKTERFQSAREMNQNLAATYKKWEAEAAGQCYEEGQADPTEPGGPTDSPRVRSWPVKIGPREGKSLFNLDILWRPKTYASPRFHVQGPALVLDEGRRMLWQRSGSPYPLPWDRAVHYVALLNQSGWEGRSNWRLPTVDELLTLIKKFSPLSDYCIDAIFDLSQRSFWSCDRRSHTASWMVNTELGFVSWQDHTCYNHVRAVASTDSY